MEVLFRAAFDTRETHCQLRDWQGSPTRPGRSDFLESCVITRNRSHRPTVLFLAAVPIVDLSHQHFASSPSRFFILLID